MGGEWVEGVDKERANLYMNFRKRVEELTKIGIRGIVLLPVIAKWGKSKSFVKINEDFEYMKHLGYSNKRAEVSQVREAHKESKTVIVYRLNEGKKAKATIKEPSGEPLAGGQEVVALYGGTRGNDILIHIKPDLMAEGKKRVVTIVDGEQRDDQQAINMEDLVPNDWVEWVGTGALSDVAGLQLAGGEDGEAPTTEDITNWLADAEMEKFNTIAFPFKDEALIKMFISYIRRVRDEEGKKVQGVIAGSGTDYEGIIQVKNGVILADGTKLDAFDAIPWVAGATAGASIKESNTYKVYEGAIDAYPRLTSRQIIDAIKAGEWVFMYDGKSVKVEKDINSLVTYGKGENTHKSKRFTSNRVMRVLDAINNDLQDEFVEKYIGKLDNSPDGYAILVAGVNGYLIALQDAKAIKNHNAKEDFVIDIAKSENSGDSVYAKIGAQPIDSIEKFYFTTEVR